MHSLHRWLTPPVFPDEEQTRLAVLFHWMLLTLIAVNLFDMVALLIFAPETLPTFWLNGVFLAATLLSFWLMRSGRVRGAGVLLCLTLWALLVGYTAESGGVTSPAFGLFAIIIIVSAVLLGVRGAVEFGLLCIASGVVLYWSGNNGWLRSIEQVPTPARTFATQTTIFVVLILLMAISGRSVWGALTRARGGEQALTERNQQLQQEIARRELAQQEQARLAATLEATSDLVATCDPRGKLLYLNHAGRRLVGIADDADVTATVIGDYHSSPTTDVIMNEGIPAAITAGTWSAEILLLSRDGHEIPVSQVIIAHRAGDGTVDYLSTIMRDMTERKRSEQVLARHQDHLEQLVEQRTAEVNRARTRLEAILNNTTDGIVLVSPNRGIEQANFTFNTLFSCEMDGYFGQPLLSLVRPEDRDRLAALIQAVVADGGGRYDEFRALRADHTIFEARFGISAIQAGESLGAGLVCSVQDISALKERERLLRYHASLQENVTDAVVSHNLEFRIQSWNAAAERIYGWNTQEVIGQRVNEIVQTEWSDQEREQYLTILWGEGHWQGQVVQRRKDGRRLHILAALSVFNDEYGEPLGIVGVNHDITQRVEAEQALAKKAEEERQFQASLRALHEITMELTQIDQLSDFYRPVVALGLERLGFERLALFLYDASDGAALGTFGTDPRGQIRDERAVRFLPDAEDILMRALGRSERLCIVEPTELRDYEQPVGVGWNAAAALWSGTAMVGWLVADNLIEQQPASQSLQEIFALYALTVGTLLGRKQTDAALRDSEARYRLLADSINDVVLRLSPTLEYRYVSPSCRAVLGYEPEELLRPPSIRGAHPNDQRAVQAFFNQLLEHPGAASITYRYRHKDGHYLWLESSGRAVVSDQAGGGVELVISARDVTDRKRAEDALRENEALLRESQQLLHIVLETIPVQVFWKDRNSIYLGGNHLVTEWAGLDSTEAMIGKNDLELPFRDNAALFMADDQAVLHTGIPITHPELLITNSTGTQRWMQTNKIALRDSQGEIIGVLGVNIDITERVQAEEELRRTLEQQKELVDLKSRFIAMASHDFRTPMSVILSSLSLLEMQISQLLSANQRDPLQKRFKRIDDAVQQMVSLLDDVLLINRADAGKVEIRPELVDVESLCHEILQEVQMTASERHVLEFTFAGETNHIASDRRLFRQILLNLLTNAIKYSPEGGHVKLNVRTEPEMLEIQVQDEGIGIPEADQARLFETFHRARNVGDIQGTGLGMAIVKRAVDALNGSIVFESQVGVGTTFVVRLPAAASAGRNSI